jgi:type IV pilus assembly protein PilZ
MSASAVAPQKLVSCYTILLQDLYALRRCYMPFVINGGLFIPVERAAALGDELLLLLSLEGQQVAVAARVVWLTPGNSSSHRQPGIGCQFLAGGVKAQELILRALRNIDEGHEKAPGATL